MVKTWELVSCLSSFEDELRSTISAGRWMKTPAISLLYITFLCLLQCYGGGLPTISKYCWVCNIVCLWFTFEKKKKRKLTSRILRAWTYQEWLTQLKPHIAKDLTCQILSNYLLIKSSINLNGWHLFLFFCVNFNYIDNWQLIKQPSVLCCRWTRIITRLRPSLEAT